MTLTLSRPYGPPAPVEDTAIIWAAYARLSRLKPKRRRGGRRRGRQRSLAESVDRQIAHVRAYAARYRLNLPPHLIFIDNGRSGWQKPGGPPPKRPQWDLMIAAGKRGEFGGLLTWKIDRFARNVRDGADLADLGGVLRGPSSARMDLRTADGLSHFSQQIEAAQHHSHETSEKINAAFQDMLANGYRIGGSGRAFALEILSDVEFDDDGWDADEDAARMGGPAVVYRDYADPERGIYNEVEALRGWARRLLAGDTIADMRRDANAAGWKTTRGGEWTNSGIARVLSNPLYGGYLAYKGEIVGRLANVEPILDEQTYADVQAKLGARKRGRKPKGTYPLTGKMHCDNPKCARKGKGTMAGYPRTSGHRSYICAINGKVPGCGQSVLAGPVEEMVRDRVVTELADQRAREQMRVKDVTLDRKRAELAELLDQLDQDMAETADKIKDCPRSMTRSRERLESNYATFAARAETAQAQLDALGPASVPAPDLPVVTAEQWDDPEITTYEDKQTILARLARGGLRIGIVPPTRRQGSSRRGFDRERVRITPP